VADMGTFSGSKVVSSTTPDGLAEVIVGNGSGMRSTIKIFNVKPTTPALVRTIKPFSDSFRGGVFFDLGRVNGDQIPDLVIGAGNGGKSVVEVRNGRSGALIKSFKAYDDDVTRQAPVRVALLDTDGNGIADKIVTVQGTDGKTREVRCFNSLTGDMVDSVLEQDEDFFGEYFLGVSGLSSQRSNPS
jgi:hypothetical protein